MTDGFVKSRLAIAAILSEKLSGSLKRVSKSKRIDIAIESDSGGKLQQEVPVVSQNHQDSLKEIQQQIIVRQDGTIEIPWITPPATPLILEIWEVINGTETFPLKVSRGRHIYCG